jgi:oxygen-independent coproporphyrinogen III oxidase
MRRAHNAMQAHNCIESALEVGYKNISVDLIYGIPQQSSDEWIKNIETVCNFGIPHISCYALTIEPKTVLQKLILSKKIAPLDDEKTVTDFNILTDILKKNNYEHYEISNFARDGNYAKHNTSYWQNKKYLGIGPSSHSFNGDSRQWNVANNAAYINSILKKIVPFEKEILTPTQKLNEKIMTSLRTMWGLNLIEFEEISGKVAMQVFASEIAPYLASGHLHIHKNVLKLSDRGIMLADKIMSDLFFED